MRARGVQPLPCIAPTASVEMALPRTGLRGPQSPARLMRIAYLDCFSGISGDMFLGALLDAGVPSQVLEETVTALNIDARLEISRVYRSGINATKVDVYPHGEKDLPREQYQKARAERKHSSYKKVPSRSPSHHPRESDHVQEHSH